MLSICVLIPYKCQHTHTGTGVTEGRVVGAVLLHCAVLALACVDLRHLLVPPLVHQRYVSIFLPMLVYVLSLSVVYVCLRLYVCP
jgi:hypothetical protein